MPLDYKKYLRRIGCTHQISPSLDWLRALHRCHVMTIPFEGIDIQLGKTIGLTLESVYHKVIEKGRGGYCYELNYLFHNLLIALGFNSRMVSAKIFENGTFGPDFDHMSLVVELDDTWLVDVGYGDLFIEPLKVTSTKVQMDQFKDYRIQKLGKNTYVLTESLKGSSNFLPRYKFDLYRRDINEFCDQNHFKQSSADSYFVKNLICTLPTENGRKTLLNDVFKTRIGDHQFEK